MFYKVSFIFQYSEKILHLIILQHYKVLYGMYYIGKIYIFEIKVQFYFKVNYSEQKFIFTK